MYKISPTLKCQQIVKKRKENNLPVYNLGLGANPIRQPDEYIDLLKKYSDKKNYSSSNGIKKLNNILKSKYSSDKYKIENIIVGNGLKELLFLLQLVFDGMIFHITPSWVSYKEQINILNKNDNLIEIHTTIDNNYKIDLEELDTKLNKYDDYSKMIIFNNPSNPTGLYYSSNEVSEISKILKKNNVIVLADEIYFNLIFEGSTISISELIPELTIRASSVSKDLGCGGYRLGWLTFPKELNDLYTKCKSVSSSMYSCPNLPIQYATADMLLLEDIFSNHCNKIKKIFKEVVEKCCKIIDKSKIKYVKPTSSWYVYLNFSNYENKLRNLNINDSHDLSLYLINKIGLVNVAGECFNSKGFNIRLSLVDIVVDDNYLDYSRIVDGLEKMIKLLN